MSSICDFDFISSTLEIRWSFQFGEIEKIQRAISGVSGGCGVTTLCFTKTDGMCRSGVVVEKPPVVPLKFG